jgi:hypothetical protein
MAVRTHRDRRVSASCCSLLTQPSPSHQQAQGLPHEEPGLSTKALQPRTETMGTCARYLADAPSCRGPMSTVRRTKGTVGLAERMAGPGCDRWDASGDSTTEANL